MSPSYKLIYFDAKGWAECARFLFKYGNIEFEDVRIKREDWPEVKDEIDPPFGQLPILEHEGKRVSQSVAISRYLGKLLKLAGNDDWENLEIDAIVDTITDLRTKIMTVFNENDEEKKKTLGQAVIKETIPFYFSRLDALVAKNKGYLALGRLTWADFYLVSMSPGFIMFADEQTFEKYDHLKALNDKVNAFPAIKKWIEVRPKTIF